MNGRGVDSPCFRGLLACAELQLLPLLFVLGSFGGFGIGNSSKFAYDFTYLNAFRVSRLITINAGFRNFRYRRVDGEGADELETRVNVLGPFLGVSFFLN